MSPSRRRRERSARKKEQEQKKNRKKNQERNERWRQEARVHIIPRGAKLNTSEMKDITPSS